MELRASGRVEPPFGEEETRCSVHDVSIHHLLVPLDAEVVNWVKVSFPFEARVEDVL